jgi:hypothetical protein
MLKKIATAAALTLGLGAATLAPTAAQAQSFGFSFGNDNGRFGFRIGDDDDDRRWRPRCISARQLDNAIERQGYRNVRIRDIDRRVTEATGVRGGWRYALTVNTCNGRIIDRDRLRRV